MPELLDAGTKQPKREMLVIWKRINKRDQVIVSENAKKGDKANGIRPS